MVYVNSEIADKIEVLVGVVNTTCEWQASIGNPLKHIKKCADDVEVWLATLNDHETLI